MVIPIGDENPRSSTPYVSWSAAALIGVAYLGSLASGRAPGGAGGFFLSPILSPDGITAAWSILALLIFADNVEDRLGPFFHACLLVGAGWAGAAARATTADSTLPLKPGFFLDAPFAGAAAAATAAAVAYSVLFPLHQIKFFHVFTPRRRGWGRLLDTGGPVSDTFYVGASLGIFIWGLGILAGAFFGPATGGCLAALVPAAGAGIAAAFVSRTQKGPPPLPSEFETEAPRPWSRPARSAARELPPIELPAAPKALHEPGPFTPRGWAVLRETDELFDVGRLGRVVARATGESFADATRRIRQTRGVLARGLTQGVAAKLVADLGAESIPAFAVDEAATGGLPPPQFARSCACGTAGLDFELDGGRKVHVPWGDVAVVAAARLDERDDQLAVAPEPAGFDTGPVATVRKRFTQTTLIDAVAWRPAARLRVARQEATFSEGSDSSSGGFRQFAGSILAHRGATPVNKGLSVISGRGAWGYLAFDGQDGYEEYLWWLLQVIRRKKGAAPVTVDRRAEDTAKYLES